MHFQKATKKALIVNTHPEISNLLSVSPLNSLFKLIFSHLFACVLFSFGKNMISIVKNKTNSTIDL